MEEICLAALESAGWNRTKHVTRTRLRKRMEYHEVLRLARCLEAQLQALEAIAHQSFLFLTADDIREIDAGWFLIVNDTNMVPLEGDNIIIVKLDERIKKTPELAKDLTLPHETHKSCVYYHLGQMLLELLDIDGNMDLLYGSPLYFTIQRALENEPTQRHWLVV